jgi:hypothetical protein
MSILNINETQTNNIIHAIRSTGKISKSSSQYVSASSFLFTLSTLLFSVGFIMEFIIQVNIWILILIQCLLSLILFYQISTHTHIYYQYTVLILMMPTLGMIGTLLNIFFNPVKLTTLIIMSAIIPLCLTISIRIFNERFYVYSTYIVLCITIILLCIYIVNTILPSEPLPWFKIGYLFILYIFWMIVNAQILIERSTISNPNPIIGLFLIMSNGIFICGIKSIIKTT